MAGFLASLANFSQLGWLDETILEGSGIIPTGDFYSQEDGVTAYITEDGASQYITEA
jgi:hypothetical protein